MTDRRRRRRARAITIELDRPKSSSSAVAVFVILKCCADFCLAHPFSLSIQRGIEKFALGCVIPWENSRNQDTNLYVHLALLTKQPGGGREYVRLNESNVRIKVFLDSLATPRRHHPRLSEL